MGNMDFLFPFFFSDLPLVDCKFRLLHIRTGFFFLHLEDVRVLLSALF